MCLCVYFIFEVQREQSSAVHFICLHGRVKECFTLPPAGAIVTAAVATAVAAVLCCAVAAGGSSKRTNFCRLVMMAF